jgi:hypothetical protein
LKAPRIRQDPGRFSFEPPAAQQEGCEMHEHRGIHLCASVVALVLAASAQAGVT